MIVLPKFFTVGMSRLYISKNVLYNLRGHNNTSLLERVELRDLCLNLCLSFISSWFWSISSDILYYGQNNRHYACEFPRSIMSIFIYSTNIVWNKPAFDNHDLKSRILACWPLTYEWIFVLPFHGRLSCNTYILSIRSLI